MGSWSTFECYAIFRAGASHPANHGTNFPITHQIPPQAKANSTTPTARQWIKVAVRNHDRRGRLTPSCEAHYRQVPDETPLGANRIPQSGSTPSALTDPHTGELFWGVDWGFLPATATGAKLPGSRTLAEGREYFLKNLCRAPRRMLFRQNGSDPCFGHPPAIM